MNIKNMQLTLLKLIKKVPYSSSIALTAINDLLFDYFLVHKVLVVAPIRVCINTWTSEIKKWDHLRDLKYSLCVGDERTRKRALYADADVYI